MEKKDLISVTLFKQYIIQLSKIVLIFLLLSCPTIANSAIYTHNDDLHFSWAPASGNVDHYNVYVSFDGKPFVKVGETTVNAYVLEDMANSHSFPIIPGAVYEDFEVISVVMKVEAENAAGPGPMSDPSEEVVVISFRTAYLGAPEWEE